MKCREREANLVSMDIQKDKQRDREGGRGRGGRQGKASAREMAAQQRTCMSIFLVKLAQVPD